MMGTGHDAKLLDAGILGVITDVHANPYALAAVLNDGANRGVKRWLVLGDLVAMGPEPGHVLKAPLCDRLTGEGLVVYLTKPLR